MGLTDITERKKAEDELLKRTSDLATAKASLERRNTALQQFADVISHDLQEPLRSVGGICHLLSKRYKGRLDDQTEQWIGFVIDGVERMQSLILELLAYPRMESKAKPFSPLNCSKVVDDAIANLHATIEQVDAQVDVDALPTVMDERLQLTQLFQNLISNGIKCRGLDSPRVQVRVQQDVANWLFSIHDNGIGIKPQHAERVFGMFKRLHTRGAHPGTGMGLAICRQVVEHHAGRIRMESEFGAGSTFLFTLPMMRGAEP